MNPDCKNELHDVPCPNEYGSQSCKPHNPATSPPLKPHEVRRARIKAAAAYLTNLVESHDLRHIDEAMSDATDFALDNWGDYLSR